MKGRAIAKAAAVVAGAMIAAVYFAFRMPGTSYSGKRPPPVYPAVRSELEQHVHRLAGETGERNFNRHDALTATAGYIETELRADDPRGGRARACGRRTVESLKPAHSLVQNFNSKTLKDVMQLPGDASGKQSIYISDMANRPCPM